VKKISPAGALFSKAETQNKKRKEKILDREGPGRERPEGKHLWVTDQEGGSKRKGKREPYSKIERIISLTSKYF